MPADRIIDLFAGPRPGGWDLGARAVGLDPVGIELDDAACQTRRAAGLRTVQGDVAWIGPEQFAFDRVDGLIASPPCQAFSMAGNGAGRRALSAYVAAAGWMSAGREMPRDYLAEQCHDERAHLVLEPLRWALALKPRWVACEQVEPVLPIWEATAAALRHHGYHVWTGVLSAEQYGVPQTRRRAFLLASLEMPFGVGPPAATHQRYIPPRRRDPQDDTLFAAPEPERIVDPAEEHLLPWVSMAQALGWETGEVGFPRLADTPSNKAAGVVEIDGVEYRERDLRDVDQPAFALTEKTRSWVRFRANAQANAAVREADEPAPTITGGHDHNERVWEAPTHMNTGRDWKPGGSREDAQTIPVDQPAPAVSAKLPTQAHWVTKRPATTIAGDPRVHPPGHKENADDPAGRFEQRRGANAVRVTIAEAAVLQSFPADHPWQGTKTKQFEQVGNAVPVLLAEAVLRSLLEVAS